jgi:hypothetical protein
VIALFLCLVAAQDPAAPPAPAAKPEQAAPAVQSPATPAAQSPATPAAQSPATPAAQSPAMARPVAPLSSDEARTVVKRAMGWMVARQNPDGSWGSDKPVSLWEQNYSRASFYAWQMAGDALCCQALMVADETPERRTALDKGMNWIISNPLPKRGSDWDIDSTWPALMGFNCMVQAASDPRFQSAEWQKRLKQRALEWSEYLGKMQDPLGGWGYYEGPVISRRPTWSTSFATASVIPALVDAAKLGWAVDPKMTERAVSYVQKCRLPTGAIQYDLSAIADPMLGEGIDNVKGSLGRIQVAGWALREAGEKTMTDERLRWGLEQFFKEHRFLDVAYLRPIPHEAYYRNAGYFYFFGHYHAARVINCLPEAEQEAWHAKLRAEIAKAQQEDGSLVDFIGSFYSWTYATSFAVMTLELGLHPERFARPGTPLKAGAAPKPAAPKPDAAPKPAAVPPKK